MKTTYTNMGTTSHRIKLDIESLPDGEIMISFANDDWGPVITGKDRKEAENKFLEALHIICIAESIRSIVSIEEHRDHQKIKEFKEKMSAPKIVDSELVY